MAEGKEGTRARRLLFLTNSEYGQANIFLAVARALLKSNPELSLHFASFAKLKSDVELLWGDVSKTVPMAKPISFHEIQAMAMEEGLRDYLSTTEVPLRGNYLPESYVQPLKFRTTLRAISDTMLLAVPYSTPEMVRVVNSVMEIVRKVEPDLVVLDTLMSAGLTACNHLGVSYVFLSPNSIKDSSMPVQPKAAGLWKFPTLFSGFSFPVPLHQIPLNIFYIFYIVYCLKTNPHIKEVAGMLRKSNIELTNVIYMLQGLTPRPKNFEILVGSLPEIDLPLKVPDYVTPCGPMLRYASPIADVDTELAVWLAKAPTVYVNLGSICKLDESRALEMARAFKTVLQATARASSESAGLQIVWKLAKESPYEVKEPGCALYELLSEEFKLDRVRIYEWIKPEPVSILQSGHIACSIHHGGANSYFEAVSSGVPQVILPQWTDCYDYAERVEVLGIGRIGNKSCKPLWKAQELSQEVLHVLEGSKSTGIKAKAAELAAICRKNGNGAEIAASHLAQRLGETLYNCQ